MLGDVLRQEREKQNLSIKDIEEETSIRALYISSIEEGNYAVIPGEVYLKGFIKTYANFLKLDGAAMLKLYYEETHAVDHKTESKDIPVKKEQVSAEQAGERKSIKKLREEKEKSAGGAMKIIVGLLVFVCLGGASYFMLTGSSAEDVKETKTVVTETVPKAKPVIEEVKAKPPVEKVNEFVEVQATFKGKCWIQVEANGKVLFEGIPNKDEILTWKADKELTLTAGNAAAIDVVLNGKSLGKLGKEGEVVTKKFTKESGALSQS